jgi:hypothetical protein
MLISRFAIINIPKNHATFAIIPKISGVPTGILSTPPTMQMMGCERWKTTYNNKN